MLRKYYYSSVDEFVSGHFEKHRVLREPYVILGAGVNKTSPVLRELTGVEDGGAGKTNCKPSVTILGDQSYK